MIETDVKRAISILLEGVYVRAAMSVNRLSNLESLIIEHVEGDAKREMQQAVKESLDGMRAVRLALDMLKR